MYAETTLLKKNEFFASSKIGKIDLYHDDNGFHIVKKGVIFDVCNAFVDKDVRGLSADQIKQFLARNVRFVPREELDEVEGEIIEFSDEQAQTLFSLGRLTVNQLSDGEYSIRSFTRIIGGDDSLVGIWLGKVFEELGSSFLVACTWGPVIFVGGASIGTVAQYRLFQEAVLPITLVDKMVTHAIDVARDTK